MFWINQRSKKTNLGIRLMIIIGIFMEYNDDIF